mgnify:CR=1 FL=1
MSTFERTEEGLAKAYDHANWMAEFHRKPFALYVPSADPTKYTCSIPSLVRAEDVERGTAANLIHPDGRVERMFQEREEPA